jgi:hypothetical protein
VSIPETIRADAVYCSARCRVAAMRARQAFAARQAAFVAMLAEKRAASVRT